MLADTMKQVREAEQQAAYIVQNARSRALTIAEEARTRGERIIQEAKTRAEEKARAELARARQEGEAEKEAYASGVREELDLSMGQVMKRAEAAADAILAELV